MNLAIRGIEAHVESGDSFRNDRHPDLKADYILANPPFNVSDWQGEQLRQDKRWEYGTPPVGNANFAWVQHFLHHLSPRGIAGFVLANGSMSSNTSGEGEIRKNIVEADLVDCIITLPGQLFRSTQIPAGLWFLRRGRQERRGETRFIDVRRLGYMVDRSRRLCRHPRLLEEIQKHGHVLTSGRYVGAAPQEDDGEPFEEKMAMLTAQWREQQAEAEQFSCLTGRNWPSIGSRQSQPRVDWGLMPTVGSLFSGIGGFDLGLELAGWRVIWQVETNPFRRRILKHYWPDVDLRGDIATDTNGLATPDLICGGFPCQDLSVAGNRAGLVGERSGLWHEYLRVVREPPSFGVGWLRQRVRFLTYSRGASTPRRWSLILGLPRRSAW